MTSRDWGGRRVARLVAGTLAAKGRTCHLCGTDGATTADHIVPRSKGGGNLLENLEPAHMACNRDRGDMDLDEWFRRHPLPVRTPLPLSPRWNR